MLSAVRTLLNVVPRFLEGSVWVAWGSAHIIACSAGPAGRSAWFADASPKIAGDSAHFASCSKMAVPMKKIVPKRDFNKEKSTFYQMSHQKLLFEILTFEHCLINGEVCVCPQQPGHCLA